MMPIWAMPFALLAWAVVFWAAWICARAFFGQLWKRYREDKKERERIRLIEGAILNALRKSTRK